MEYKAHFDTSEEAAELVTGKNKKDAFGLEYRADIDGLRAIAILSVLLFHAGVDGFSGGFVGVDIFFVISGFLITATLVREIKEKRLSLLGFYERRFRRILPMAFFVILMCIIVGYFVLDSYHYKKLAESVFANNVFLSNIYFQGEVSYFDDPSELKPLLHTWTLAVEEQFYLIFPITLVLISYFRVSGVRWLYMALAVSFMLSVYMTGNNSSEAFYYVHSRAWQFLLGGVLALSFSSRSRNDRGTSLIAGVGLFLIVYSIVTFTEETRFPGPYAAIPSMGAAFIIYSGSNGSTFVSRLLSLQPFVFIGLISYSLYLWHWPIFVFFKFYNIIELGSWQKIGLIIISVFLSFLSYRFIETPIRLRRVFESRHSLFLGTAVITVVFVFTSVLLVKSEGLPQRYSSEGLLQIHAEDHEGEHWFDCERALLRNQETLCTLGSIGEPEFLLWGDSHARAIASAISMSAARRGASGVLATRSACPPLDGIERPGRRTCHIFNKGIHAYIADHPGIRTVILAARWTISVESHRYKQENGMSIRLIDISDIENSGLSNALLFERGLRRTINKIQQQGIRVVLMRPIPEVGYDVPSALHAAVLTGRDVNAIIAPTFPEYARRNANVTAIINRLEHELHITTVNPASLLCDQDVCRVATDDGFALYRDDDHLSTYGSIYVSSIFDSLFEKKVGI